MPTFSPLGSSAYIGQQPAEQAPVAWAPAMSLDPAAAGGGVELSFIEPSAWARYPWHIPADGSGTWVPLVGGPKPTRQADLLNHATAGIESGSLTAATKAWHGAGPIAWDYTVDGMLFEAQIAARGRGQRNVIPLPSGSIDWTLQHSFRLVCVYEDVPSFQWWEWQGTFGRAPAGVDNSHYYFHPAWKFRGDEYPAGYPADDPDYTDYAPYDSIPPEGFAAAGAGSQPILPPSVGSLDYGGLGPFERAPQHLVSWDVVRSDDWGRGLIGVFSRPQDFTNPSDPGVYLLIESEPSTLSLAGAPVTVPAPASFTRVTIQGSPVVGQTLTAVLS